MLHKRFLEVLLLAAGLLGSAEAVKNLRIVSPLKAFTIWDPAMKDIAPTARSGFLATFKARLQAESEARKELKAKKDQDLQASATAGEGWAKDAAASDRRRRLAEERYVEDISDRAAAQLAESSAASSSIALAKSRSNPNQYQFVGVVNTKISEKPIKWYARKKPAGSKWSVRLVHVDQAAVVTDMFRRGEVDIFAKYKNTGKVKKETNVPIVESKYTVRERSLR